MARRALVLVLSFGAMLLLWLAFGCTAFDDATLPLPDAATASAEGGGDAGHCGVHPPAIDRSAPSGGDISFVVALKTLGPGFVDGGPSPTFGYYFDNACTTCPDGVESCTPPDGGKKRCDGEDGRDNALGQITTVLSGYYADLTTQFSRTIALGQNGVLLRLDGYNGAADDSDVVVSIFGSAGTYIELPDGGSGGPRPPTFARDEKWSVNEKGLVQKPQYESNNRQNGYVVGGKLVVELGSSALPFVAEPGIVLSSVTGIATIVNRGEDGWALEDGIFVGRWPAKEAIRTFTRFPDPSDSTKRICQNAAFSKQVRDLVCAAIDIAPNRNQDNNPGQRCTHLSTAFAFTATEATFGAIVSPALSDPCATITPADCWE